MKRRNKKEDVSRHLQQQQQMMMTVGYGSDQDRLAIALPTLNAVPSFPE
jgi:hypothetical protein